MNKKRKPAEDDEVETKSSRQTSNSSSTILPQICIFCGGDSKYKTGRNTTVPLRCCA